VEGFKNGERTFGVVKCYPVLIENKIKGAIITAMRTHYDVSVLEVIAPICLRKHLNLKDGNKVKVEILTLT
jgi:riboflavin kinase